MPASFTIVGLGEALFDVFGADQRLGGAPLNVAVHAHQMLAGKGLGRGVVVSRVGQDALGREVADELRQRGMDPGYLQTDPDRPTGRVFVRTNAEGDATYDIEPDVAWDVIHFDPDLEDLARECDAVAFGSLAQRSGESRSTIYRFLGTARRAVKLFDVNLRGSGGQKFYDRGTLMRSCELANIVKLNDEEMPDVGSLLGIDDAESLRKKFDLEAVVLTRGAKGTAAVTASGLIEGEPAQADKAEGSDTVGAGDSCTAAVLTGRVLGKPWPETLTLANRVAAFVVGQSGATPPLPDEIAAMV